MTAIPETREGAADIVIAGTGPLALRRPGSCAKPCWKWAPAPLFNGFMNALLTVRSGGDGAIPTGRGGPTYPNSKGNSK